MTDFEERRVTLARRFAADKKAAPCEAAFVVLFGVEVS